MDAAAIDLVVALRERGALEHRAGAAIQAMLAEGLTLADITGYTDGELTTRDARRLAREATDEDAS